jgi:hypothetical protein
MKILLGILLVFISHAAFPGTGDKTNDWVFQQADKELVEKVFARFGNEIKTEPGDLLLKIALSFLETPYVAHTLETGASEKMVVNLRELDCTTFAENVLALTRTIKYKKQNFENFVRELESIRYRNGLRDGYLSRLHYFSEWIYNNDKRGNLKEVGHQIADTPYEKQINFMSRHPESYQVLKENPDLLGDLKNQEAAIAEKTVWYIPESNLKDFEEKLKDGDIVAITTQIEGLDVIHVGIVIRRDGRVRLLHASSNEMKVVVTKETLEDYLLRSKSSTGIMAARPL